MTRQFRNGSDFRHSNFDDTSFGRDRRPKRKDDFASGHHSSQHGDFSRGDGERRGRSFASKRDDFSRDSFKKNGSRTHSGFKKNDLDRNGVKNTRFNRDDFDDSKRSSRSDGFNKPKKNEGNRAHFRGKDSFRDERREFEGNRGGFKKDRFKKNDLAFKKPTREPREDMFRDEDFHFVNEKEDFQFTSPLNKEDGFDDLKRPSRLYPESVRSSERAVSQERAETEEASGEVGDTLLCGIKPVREMLEREPSRVDVVYIRRGAHGEAASIVDSCREAGVRFHLAEPRELARMLEDEQVPSGTVHHQGVIARLSATSYTEYEELLAHVSEAPLPLIIMADQVQDPGNLGTLARTLYALGGAGLVVPKNNSAFLGVGARRAAAGALERLPVSRVVNLSRAIEEAVEAGFHVYGAGCGEGSTDLYKAEIEFPAILVLGSEESGIRHHVAGRCENVLRIPMRRNFDSLNVAQAGAICIAECALRYSNKENV